MFAGSQAVHAYYRPLQDLDSWVNNYKHFLKLKAQPKQTDSSDKQQDIVAPEEAKN